jgi:triosephosphate isomerase
LQSHWLSFYQLKETHKGNLGMPTRNLWIGTSWKMNKTLAGAIEFAEALRDADAARDPRIQRFVIPSFTLVRQVKDVLANTFVRVGVQNMHWADQGAWTGEVSPLMIKDCGASIVELGHSERREHFGETNDTVGLKTEAAVRHGMTPLICIGETLDERNTGRAQDVMETQVSAALGQLTGDQKNAEILLAYEPVWAIGENGIPATSEYADDRQAEIIAVARDVLGHTVPCLYGGSVNPGNCEELITCPNIDGLFIGRSAWDVKGYIDILTRCAAKI